MKITKEQLKNIISEELKSVLEEQTIMAKAGEEAARRKEVARRMAARGKEIADLEARLAAAKAAPKDAFASVTDLAGKLAAATGEQEPIDLGTQTIRARRPNRQVVQLQKALGVRADGIIGPKTVAAYNARVKPDKPITVQTLKSLMRNPNMVAGLIGSIPPGKAPARAVAAPKGKARPQLSAKDRAEIEAGLKGLEDLDLGLEEQANFQGVLDDVAGEVALATGAGKKKKKQANFQSVLDDTAGEVAAATGATPMSGGGSAKPQRTEIPSQQRSFPQQTQSSAASTQAQMKANAKKELMKIAKFYTASEGPSATPEEIKVQYDGYLKRAGGDLFKALEAAKKDYAEYAAARAASTKGPGRARAKYNPTVEKVQQALADKGFGKLLGRAGVDGKLGGSTRKAIAAFRRSIAKTNGAKFASRVTKDINTLAKFLEDPSSFAAAAPTAQQAAKSLDKMGPAEKGASSMMGSPKGPAGAGDTDLEDEILKQAELTNESKQYDQFKRFLK